MGHKTFETLPMFNKWGFSSFVVHEYKPDLFFNWNLNIAGKFKASFQDRKQNKIILYSIGSKLDSITTDKTTGNPSAIIFKLPALAVIIIILKYSGFFHTSFIRTHFVENFFAVKANTKLYSTLTRSLHIVCIIECMVISLVCFFNSLALVNLFKGY